MIGRHIDNDADAKAKKDSLFDPRVHSPAGWCRPVRFRGTNGAGRQCGAQAQKCVAGLSAIDRRTRVE
jgi:hypothetical protein